MKYIVSIIAAFFIYGSAHSQNADTTIYETTLLSSFPVFPGCEDTPTEECLLHKIVTHVNQSVKYPEPAKEMGIQGKVFVKFVFEIDGTISNVHVVRSIDEYLDAEAVRVIKKLPKFLKPAMIDEKEVRVSYILPISFSLY